MKTNKLVAEFIGTATLVVFGCGTAMVTGCEHWGGYLLTALAFGLVIVGMAYCVGNISGCHINPAVSLGVLLSGGMTVSEFIGYFVAQVLGATAGAGILALIFSLGGIQDATGGFGSNGLAGVGGNAEPLACLWVFIVGPLVGAALAAVTYKALEK